VSTQPLTPDAPGPDASKLEQALRLQQSLLLGSPVGDLAGRLCQSAALLVGAVAARLVTVDPDDAVAPLASYGNADFAALPAEALRRAGREGRPAILDAGPEHAMLSIPLDGADPAIVLQIVGAPGRPFSAEQIALARYAGTLAAIALRQAGSRERLERADHTKSEILVAVSHDLRTPLNVMIGYTRLLIEEAYGPCPPEQQQVLATIERHALELLSLLSGALDLMRIDLERGGPRHDEFSLADVLGELCTGALAARVAAGVHLAWHVDPEVPPMRSDRFRVRQIVQNLVENALRFTDQGEVAIDAHPHAGGVRLTVSDTGPGIHGADLPHLFEIFRPGAARAERSSTGCGLYLVKRFSESLGGHVGVESALGRGTRFTVDLPLAS
jgi:signal transduction histidine kinase